MGKGIISSNNGGGQYAVSIQYDVRRVTLKISRLTARISELDSKIAAESDENKLAALKARRLALQQEKDKLQAVNESETVTAWCADLTEDLAGTVGTAEIARDHGEGLVILPGYEDGAEYSAERDGQIQHPLASTAFQAYLNLCLFPAAQKYAPRYRVGEITSISGNNCDIRLDAVTSRIRSISVNKAISLTNVPILYMNCNGAAFDTGDRALVKFRGGDWDSPEVIGFETHPQPCAVGPCYLTGEIVEIIGDINLTHWCGAVESNDQRIIIRDTERDITGIRCIQSDWINWEVGDQVVAMHLQNCAPNIHCSGDGVRHIGIIFELINQLRKDLGVGPVYMNRRLSDAALIQAQWCADTLYIGHDGPGGSTFEERIIDDAEYAIRSNDNYVVGENVGFAKDAEQMFQLWMDSPGHYANMIRDTYEEMGLAVVLITESGPVTHYSLGVLHDIEANTKYSYAQTFGWVDPPYWHITPVERLPDD